MKVAYVLSVLTVILCKISVLKNGLHFRKKYANNPKMNE